jgi:hypothetical protein
VFPQICGGAAGACWAALGSGVPAGVAGAAGAEVVPGICAITLLHRVITSIANARAGRLRRFEWRISILQFVNFVRETRHVLAESFCRDVARHVLPASNKDVGKPSRYDKPFKLLPSRFVVLLFHLRVRAEIASRPRP